MYERNPQVIAAALSSLAADLAALGGADLPAELAVSVSVSFQVCSWAGGDATRRDVVDRLSALLLGVPGRAERNSDGSWHHATPFEQRARDALRVDVFTAVSGSPDALATLAPAPAGGAV